MFFVIYSREVLSESFRDASKVQAKEKASEKLDKEVRANAKRKQPDLKPACQKPSISCLLLQRCDPTK